ncbi:MAG TPA: proton-conducting transporter membrane subunit [Planctomycetia bacterium]|nr:proton-conducting transporter membrane subunit [Planctomycetia bacterium]
MIFAQSLAVHDLPCVDVAMALPFAGAIWVAFARDPSTARKRSIFVAGVVLLAALGAWIEVHARPDGISPARFVEAAFPHTSFAADSLSAAPMLLAALVYLMTPVVTVRTKMPRFSFAGALVGEGLAISLLAARDAPAIALLLALAVLPPLYELRARGKPLRVFALHMGAFVFFLFAGVFGLEKGFAWSPYSLAVAIAIRTGLAPFHLWIPDLFAHASFGRALVFLVPMPGAYAACRLLLPGESDLLLRILGILALATAVYAAGMALVQSEPRRFFAYFTIGASALVFVGMETASPLGVAGALAVWISAGVALAGMGLSLRALEARHGEISLRRLNGLRTLSPVLAAGFLLSGLACVGFPGTLGFVGSELLLAAAVHSYPVVGAAVVFAAALQGIAVVKVYFALFAGKPPRCWLPEIADRRERIGVYAFAALLLIGGFFPQPVLSARHRAAEELLARRAAVLAAAEAEPAAAALSAAPGQGVGGARYAP